MVENHEPDLKLQSEELETAQIREASKSGMSVESYCVSGGLRLSSGTEIWQIPLNAIGKSCFGLSHSGNQNAALLVLGSGVLVGRAAPLLGLPCLGMPWAGPCVTESAHEPPLLGGSCSAHGGDPVLATDVEQCVQDEVALQASQTGFTTCFR